MHHRRRRAVGRLERPVLSDRHRTTGAVGFGDGFANRGREIFRQPLRSAGITIGDDVWLGSHVVVDGVRIGSHAVVGAGSVVTRDVPEWAVVVGNPARVPAILGAAWVDGLYWDSPLAPPTV